MPRKKKSAIKTWLWHNSLSIALVGLMVFSISGQIYTGWHEHNDFLNEYGAPAITLAQYLHSGHFVSATFENWESEFLQIALFVVLTIFLRQRGSSESKGLDEKKEEVDRKPRATKDAPWPVKQGGWVLMLYEHSLTIVITLLFIFSFWMHWYGSWINYNEEQTLKGLPTEQFSRYVGHCNFWFESFQNWQSEFFSLVVLIILSIYLRQKGSPQSKPVDAPHTETGE